MMTLTYTLKQWTSIIARLHEMAPANDRTADNVERVIKRLSYMDPDPINIKTTSGHVAFVIEMTAVALGYGVESNVL